MPGFEGAAGSSIFSMGNTANIGYTPDVWTSPGKSTLSDVGSRAIVGGLLIGGFPATAASWGLTFQASYDVVTPLIPAIFTKIKGNYKGKKYEVFWGFGYDETLPAKHHPATAWFMTRHRALWGRRSPWSAVRVPMFGLGWGSKLVQAESSSQSYQQNGGSPGQQKNRTAPGGRTSHYPPRPQGGFGGKPAGGTKKGSRPRSVPPYCWKHQKRHYCRITSR